METVKVASLGQITTALFEVGGQYPAQHVTSERHSARAGFLGRNAVHRHGPHSPTFSGTQETGVVQPRTLWVSPPRGRGSR
jgi:hypothetical protein